MIGVLVVKFMETTGFKEEQILIVEKIIEKITTELDFPFEIVKKAINRKHVIFITHLFHLKMYEKIALYDNKIKLIYQHEDFAKIIDKLFLQECVDKLEQYVNYKLTYYYSTPFELIGDYFQNHFCLIFDKRPEEKVDSEIKKIEEQLCNILAKKIRQSTARGPEYCKVTILDRFDTVYQIKGWLSHSWQRGLNDEKTQKVFFITVKNIIESIIKEVEPNNDYWQKIYIDINVDNNYLLIINHREDRSNLAYNLSVKM